MSCSRLAKQDAIKMETRSLRDSGRRETLKGRVGRGRGMSESKGSDLGSTSESKGFIKLLERPGWLNVFAVSS